MTSGAPIERIIKAAVDRGASDLHIKAGDLFRARIEGRLVPLTKQRLTPDQTRSVALKLMATDEDRARIDHLQDYDCSWGLAGVGRFRVNILRQRSSFMIVMRVIPFTVPTIDELALPETIKSLSGSKSGLILVTGMAGSGRSSTIAALIHHLNQHHERHVITVEDPIEFLHRDLKSSITQREVGVDTASIKTGVRAALRQDADVIFVSEIHDADTLETAIKAAESGRLVIGSMSTPDVLSTIGQVLAILPREDRQIGQVRFAEALTAVVSQMLLPRKSGDGRVPAVEVLIASPPNRQRIRDSSRILDLRAMMAQGYGKTGMQTFDQHVTELFKAGAITTETARAVAGPLKEQPPARSGGKR
jgi:twitching motility protein PilT